MTTTKISESAKRNVPCPRCLARAGRPCRSSRIPGANTLGGGWGGPPDLDRAHPERRDAALALRRYREDRAAQRAGTALAPRAPGAWYFEVQP